MSEETEQSANNGRNADGTFAPGNKLSPGRPRNTMKDYLRRKFSGMPDEVKEAFLQEHKVSGVDQIKLAEGNPAQDVGLGQAENLKPLIIPSEIIIKNDLPSQSKQDCE